MLPIENLPNLNSKALVALTQSGECSEAEALLQIFEHHVESVDHWLSGSLVKPSGPFFVQAGDSQIEVRLWFEYSDFVYLYVLVEVRLGERVVSDREFWEKQYPEGEPAVTIESVGEIAIKLARKLMVEAQG